MTFKSTIRSLVTGTMIATSMLAAGAFFQSAYAQDSNTTQPPPGGCMTQAERDAALAKAEDELSDLTKKLSQAETDVASDQKQVDSWNPRMGEKNPEIVARRERLAADTAIRDVLAKQRAQALAKLSALMATTPCPAPTPGAVPQPVPPGGGAAPSGNCKTQEEIDDEVADATDDLLYLMALVRDAEDDVLNDQKRVDSFEYPDGE